MAKEIVRSKNYGKVKGFYDGGFWNETRVRNAVVKGWITADEYEEITGNRYDV